MTTPSASRFPALPTPQACLAALLSPIPTAANVGPPLPTLAPAGSSSRLDLADVDRDDRTSMWLPMQIPLPGSSPQSAVGVGVGDEGDIGFRDPHEAHPLIDRADVATLFGVKSTTPVVVELPALDIEDRQQMDQLMGLGSSKAACDMASEVISLILPALPRGQGFTSSQRAQASAVQEMDVSDALKLWVGLAPSPLVALIVTVILLERMSARFPELGGLGSISLPDAPLRLTFAAFLLAVKWTSDVSHLSVSFVPYTPWSLREVNRMERELLGCLGWDVYVSAKELLHRAAGFWREHADFLARVSRPGDGTVSADSALLGDYFLMKKRSDVASEPSWKGGLMKPTAQGGRRMSMPYDEHGDRAAQQGDGGQGITAWRAGRLERTGVNSADQAGPSSSKDGQGRS